MKQNLKQQILKLLQDAGTAGVTTNVLYQKFEEEYKTNTISSTLGQLRQAGWNIVSIPIGKNRNGTLSFNNVLKPAVKIEIK